MSVKKLRDYYWMRMCKLSKNDNGVNRISVCWIPEKYAKVGKTIRIKGVISGEWEDGWLVETVSKNRKRYREVYERANDYKNTRKTSDI